MQLSFYYCLLLKIRCKRKQVYGNKKYKNKIENNIKYTMSEAGRTKKQEGKWNGKRSLNVYKVVISVCLSDYNS